MPIGPLTIAPDPPIPIPAPPAIGPIGSISPGSEPHPEVDELVDGLGVLSDGFVCEVGPGDGEVEDEDGSEGSEDSGVVEDVEGSEGTEGPEGDVDGDCGDVGGTSIVH